MNTINLTQEDWEKKIMDLYTELQKSPNKMMKRLNTRRIRQALKVLDRYHENQAFRQRGNSSNREDYFKVREQEGWTPYRDGVIKMGVSVVVGRNWI